MRFVDVIRRKRDGATLSAAEIQSFVHGVTDGSIPDYQIAAFLMAVVWRGMSADETAVLTDAMVASGRTVDLRRVPGRKVDKHSTGGVGDKTSLVVAPLVAACGVPVPMMSGRALGHTGGTLDKLESIPGFQTALTIDQFIEAVSAVGCALIGQTDDIAPADRRLYALRDVTATVPSVPLICGSIMSKKIAEGIDALVLDVKCGSGAFMRSPPDARALARALTDTGRRAGLAVEVVVSRMDAPLGRSVGNAIEVIESVEALKGRGPGDLEALSVLIAVRMLRVAGVADSDEDAERRVRGALASGAGLEKLRAVIARQHGDPRVVDDYSRLPSAPTRRMLTADRDGWLERLDARAVGRAAMALGAGRDRVGASIDHGVGIIARAKPGDQVRRGDPILELLYRDASRLADVEQLCTEGMAISDEPPVVEPLVLDSKDRAEPVLSPGGRTSGADAPRRPGP